MSHGLLILDEGCGLVLAAGAEVRQDVDGHGEDDGRVLLGRDVPQGLEIPQLESRRRLGDDV